MPWNRPIEILQDTPDWVAVAKPAGLATIPGRGEDDSVLKASAAQLGLPRRVAPADPRIRVVHRLDKDTSGVLLFAKHTAAQRHFSHQFQNNTVEKEYLALVAGEPREPRRRDRRPPRPATRPTPSAWPSSKHGGRPARTLWQVEQRFRGLTLLRVFPKTGKTHQIRVHLKHIGLPLAIDPLYHPRRSRHPPGLFLSTFKRDYRPTRGEEERPLIARLTLHAHRLTVTDMSGERVTLECPPPKDFRATLTQLARHARAIGKKNEPPRHGDKEARLYCRAAIRVRDLFRGSVDSPISQVRQDAKQRQGMKDQIFFSWRCLASSRTASSTSRKESISPLPPEPRNQPTGRASRTIG